MANLLELDWTFLREGASDLENYLLSPELYWPLTATPGSRPVSGSLQFTLGNLQLARARLGAVTWPSERQAELEEMNRKIDQVRERWRANWSRKAARESVARLKLWMNYINELSDEVGRRGAGYPYEVRWRAILALLAAEAQTPLAQEEQALVGLDARLKAISVEAPFVWEDEVRPAFPRDAFWYLYRRIRQNRAGEPS